MYINIKWLYTYFVVFQQTLIIVQERICVDEGYKHALLFVIPSFYEDFRLPMLEAMSMGLPIACSNVTSLPEVAGSAAVYFNPYNYEDIADKLSMVLSNGDLREELIVKGYKQSKKFSWQKCATETIEIYIIVSMNP